jgi:hypothetical protein
MEGTPMARTSLLAKGVVLLAVSAGLAGAASAESPAEAGKGKMKLGIQGKVVDIGFGNGIETRCQLGPTIRDTISAAIAAARNALRNWTKSFLGDTELTPPE